MPELHMDRIHHALGSPEGPWVEPYRNWYITAECDPLVDSMLASGAWEERKLHRDLTDGGRCLMVTEAGRKAHREWLTERTRGIKAWEATFDGLDGSSTVHAPTRSKARYRAWLNIHDCFPDTRLIDVRVRRAP